MKKTQKKNISEATAEAMGLGGYSQSGGQSNYDATGKGDMIAQPVDFGGAAMAQAQVPIGAGMAAPVQMQASSQEDTGEDEEMEDEDMEETMEDDDTEETNEEAKADFKNALVSLLGEDVSPSLINQLEGIFEAVVAERVEKNVAVIVEKVDSNVKSYLENVTESLVEKVDDYLDYVVEEWMTENAVAVEQGVKTQIAENFISGLKNLFENHYIDVPAEKYNVLDELYAHNMELANRLNESMKVNMDLKKEVSLTECAGIFVAESRDLADTQVAKLQTLMESINFNTPEEYREKLVAIRENYLTRNRPAPTQYSEPEQTFSTVNNAPTSLVESYVGALGRLHKKV
jgi:hypothetical protein